jgi:steroid delta-isomerase-like uncharacterized protein
MTSQETAALVRKLFDYYSAHKLDEVERLFAPNSETVTMPTGERSLGPDGARRDTERWIRAFPDLKFTVVNIVATDDAAAVETVFTGTNTGPLVTPEGELPPTGNRVEAKGCIVFKFEKGKVLSEHDYFDFATINAQLGLGPELTPPTEEARSSV